MKLLSGDNCAGKTKKQLIRCAVLVLLCVMCFSMTGACVVVTRQSYTFEDAVEAGVISAQENVSPDEQQPGEYSIVSPVIQELIESRSLQALLFFPVEKDLFFDHTEGEVTVFVEEGQHVSRGDLLATLCFDVDERYYIDYDAAVAHLERLEQEFSRERTRRRNEISRAREELPEQAVRLLEIELQRYNFQSSLTVFELEEEISVLRKSLGTEEITAPYDGMVFFVFEGDSISLDNSARRIMRIVDPSDFFFQISISATHSLETNYNIMGHGDIVTLIERTESDENEADLSAPRMEFESRVVTDSWAAGQRQVISFLLKPTDIDGLMDKLLEQSDDNPIHTLRNLRFSALIEYLATPKGITLPVVAIHREHTHGPNNQITGEQHYVFIDLDGNVEKRSVILGKTVGGYVHIVTGIDEDAKVVIQR